MFEGQVAYYLNKYLGTYLEGIDSASLRISVFRGNVELTNLQLKPDALDDLDLPVVVKGGLLGSLSLKVGWSSAGTEATLALNHPYVFAALVFNEFPVMLASLRVSTFMRRTPPAIMAGPPAIM